MDLGTLANRIAYEDRPGAFSKEVKIMDAEGRIFDVLSLNWDRDKDCWVIIADGDS